MGIQEEGIAMEQWLLGYFRKTGRPVFQPDAISYEDGHYILNEVKNQEHFKAPPFDGHGLPPYQVEARILFWERTGIRCRFVVKEKGTKKVYWQWLDVLEGKEHYDTRGKSPRRVYPLKSFVSFSPA